ncbi:hypothetical protein [Streptomyces pratensis]
MLDSHGERSYGIAEFRAENSVPYMIYETGERLQGATALARGKWRG